jgi:hypothetical protein
LYPNDPTVFEKVKYLGILAVDLTDAARNVYSRAGMPVRPGEPFIDLHLNPYLCRSELGMHAARRSMAMLAEFIQAHPDEIPEQQIYGVTTPGIGRLATHLGFEHTHLFAGTLPMEVISHITGDDLPQIVAVHQSTADVVARFGGSDQPTAPPLVARSL